MGIKKSSRVLALVTLCVLHISLDASPKVIVNEQSNQIELIGHLDYLLDTQDLSLKDVQAFRTKFQPLEKSTANFGKTYSVLDHAWTPLVCNVLSQVAFFIEFTVPKLLIFYSSTKD